MTPNQAEAVPSYLLIYPKNAPFSSDKFDKAVTVPGFFFCEFVLQ
jgi:hypothetical protein